MLYSISHYEIVYEIGLRCIILNCYVYDLLQSILLSCLPQQPSVAVVSKRNVQTMGFIPIPTLFHK